MDTIKSYNNFTTFFQDTIIRQQPKNLVVQLISTSWYFQIKYLSLNPSYPTINFYFFLNIRTLGPFRTF